MDFAASYHSTYYCNGNIKLEELSVSLLSDCSVIKLALVKRGQEASRIGKGRKSSSEIQADFSQLN